ncbi:nif11-like leader peptide domain protein [Synechococcus sp. BIOS-E4-1]|uniref:Nif11-like leader peptide family natural product precursor n=1 Tax=Synechococcus sp. BIOS-E4-1 TaxID=1400864 RepID=UPI0016456020|nr:Nif11-like leader peptide family natural product precursor [Synechococcus sp. BIOS-E4-1]QNI54982.1 nif11-like leader peptide domain protein [Synechococcus sp. BIOS-E4-1]
MTQQQLTVFLTNAKGNNSLQERLKAAAGVNAVATIAKEAGFVIYVDGLNKAQSKLSEKDLEGAAGGGSLIPGAFTCRQGCR